MIFIVISQRAKGNKNFSLKDLPGHGRIDVIFRVILAALRPITANTINTAHIFTYMKGAEPHGWLHLTADEFDFLAEDEISLAAKLQKKWHHYWTEGSQAAMYTALQRLVTEPKWIELHAEGESLKQWQCADPEKLVILLGAQRDMTDEDTAGIMTYKLSLGETMYLASQAITIIRAYCSMK